MINDFNNLSGIEFEILCQHVLESLGFTTEITKAVGDGGIDIIAHNNQAFFYGKYVIQCKRYSGGVGEPIIRDLYGVVTSERANKGILITTGYFTSSAVKFSEDKNIELIDGEKLCQIIYQNNITLSSIQESPEFILREELQRTGLSVDEYQYYFGDEEAAANLIICKKELLKNNIINLHAKAIAILYSRLERILFNENKINFDYSSLAIQGCNCIEKYAAQILLVKPKSNSEKRIKYNTMYIMCLCDIIRGNISNAIIRYIELLNTSDLEEHMNAFNKRYKLHLLRAICSLLRILGAYDIIEMYGDICQDVIDDIIFENSEIIRNSKTNNPQYVSALEKENSELVAMDFTGDNAIIIPVEDLCGGINWLEDYVDYNIKNISYNDGKLKIYGEWHVDISNPLKTSVTSIEFNIDSLKIESEKNRLKILL